jgi:hypothetical protein
LCLVNRKLKCIALFIVNLCMPHLKGTVLFQKPYAIYHLHMLSHAPFGLSLKVPLPALSFNAATAWEFQGWNEYTRRILSLNPSLLVCLSRPEPRTVTVVTVDSLLSLYSPYFIDCLANLFFRCFVSSLSATGNCGRVVSIPSTYS